MDNFESSTPQNNQNINLPELEGTAFDFDIDGVAGLVGAKSASQEVQKPKLNINRKDKKALKKQYKQQLRCLKSESRSLNRKIHKVQKKQNHKSKTISQMLKERDKAISDKSKLSRIKRRNATNVVDFIGYERMFVDGICEVEKGIFSQTIKFPDISYQSSREDSQKEIFKTMCDIYDYFGPRVSVQLSVVNTQLRDDEIGTREFFKESEQVNDRSRKDAKIFNQILNKKMKEGISNIKRTRYLTYCIAATNVDAAVPQLARIKTDIAGFFAKIGCTISVVNGHERLNLIYNTFNPESQFIFNYNKDISLSSNCTTKDYVAPSVLDFSNEGKDAYFQTGSYLAKVMSFRNFGSELDDRIISDLVDLPIPMTVTWHVQP